MDNKDLCLLRKGGFILGPYTYEKTKKLLLQRELKVIDEVVFPGGHWAFLRDCPMFANIVEKLRKQDLISDDENTETVNRYSSSLSYTSSMARINNSELFEGKDKKHISAVEVLSSETPSVQSHYGSSKYANKKAKKGLWPIWIFLGLTVTILAYVLLISKKESQPVASSQEINHEQQALSYYNSGQYKKSLESFNNMQTELSSESLIFYAALLLNDKQTVSASRAFNEAMGADKSNQYKSLVGMGLVSLLEGEVRFADKNFKQALGINPRYMPALFNIGVIQFYKNQFAESADYFKKAYKYDNQDQSSLIMYIISLIKQHGLSKEAIYLEMAGSALQSAKRHVQYKQELSLLSSYIHMLNGDAEALSESLVGLIDEDPYLSQNHKKNLMIDVAPLSWVSLNKEFCQKIIRSGLQVPVFTLQMLDVLCLVKSGQLSHAGEKIKSFERPTSGKPLFGALSAYVEKESNSRDEALITIGNAIDNNRLNEYKLPSIMQAQFCEEVQDFECSLRFWTKVSSIDPDSVSAKVGRIRAQIKLKRVPSSDKNLEGLLQLYPKYLPINKMAEENNII